MQAQFATGTGMTLDVGNNPTPAIFQQDATNLKVLHPKQKRSISMNKKNKHAAHVANRSQANQEKQKLQTGLVVILVAVVLLGAIFFANNVGQANQGFPSFVNVQEAYALYQQNDVFVLDVREQFEWDEVHIPNTTLIPLGELAGRVNEVPRDAKVVVVCRSGNRSQEGRDILKRAGFENVTSMNGGVVEWRASGYPVQP